MLAVWGLGDVFWSMLVLFFWVMAIWIFIAMFGDIFRRSDLSGGAKAGWILLLFILPFFGAMIYIISRPAIVEGQRGGGYNAAASDAGGTNVGPRVG